MISFCTRFQFYDNDLYFLKSFIPRRNICHFNHRHETTWRYQSCQNGMNLVQSGHISFWYETLCLLLRLTWAENVEINVFQLKSVSFLVIFVEGFSWQVAVLLSTRAHSSSHHRSERERQPSPSSECSRWKLRYWARNESRSHDWNEQ